MYSVYLYVMFHYFSTAQWYLALNSREKHVKKTRRRVQFFKRTQNTRAKEAHEAVFCFTL